MDRSIEAELLLAQSAWVQGLARKLVRDPGRAEDVAQETLLTALDRPPHCGRDERSLRAWLARVSRRLVQLGVRTDARRAAREESTAPPDRQSSSAEVVQRAEQHRTVVEAVMALEEPYRSAVLLRYFDGLRTDAIAREQGVSSAAARKRLSRGIEMLRARLDADFGGDRGAWCAALSVLVAPTTWDLAKVGAWELFAMGTKGKIGIAAVAAVLAVALLWRVWPVDPTPREGGAGPVVAAEPAPPVEAVEAEAIEAPPQPTGRAELVPSAGECLLVVTDPDGRAVGGAPIALLDGESVRESGSTDAAGRYALPAGDGAASLVVAPRGSAPHRIDVRLEPGRREVRLERGFVLSGWLVVDGGPPRSSRRLIIMADHTARDLDGTPRAVWDALDVDPVRVEVQTDIDGRFRFWGLAPDWSGEMWLPRRYHALDRELLASRWILNTLRFLAPVEDARIDVTWNPVLTGRVIESAAGDPVEGAVVFPRIQVPDTPGGIGGIGHHTDAGGRFEIPLRGRSVPSGSELMIGSPDGRTSRAIPLEPRELAEDWDVGDLELHVRTGAAEVALVVQDRAGRPIEGAVAVLEQEAPVPSRPTDESGRTVLEGAAPGESSVRVVAVGFRPTCVALPPDLEEPLLVTLARSNLLEVVVRTPSGDLPRSARVQLGASEPPLLDEGRDLRALLQDESLTLRAFSAWDDRLLTILASESGRYLVSGLKAGLPFTVQVIGRFDGVAAEKEIDPLGPEELRMVEVVLDRSPRTLTGRVLDEEGRPIAGAWVSVSLSVQKGLTGRTRSNTRNTDASGGFSIGGIYAERLCLGVEKSGYSPIQFPELELPLDDRPVEFRLAPGLEVRVVVEDENGVPQEAMVFTILDGGNYLFGGEIEAGVYLVRDLPDREVTINATVQGVTYERTHDPRVAELRFTVPVGGVVDARVSLPGGLLADDNCSLWLLPEEPEGMSRASRIDDPTATEALTLLLEGVPPGRYEAVVRRYVEGDGADVVFEDVTERVAVEVATGETTRIEIGP